MGGMGVGAPNQHHCLHMHTYAQPTARPQRQRRAPSHYSGFDMSDGRRRSKYVGSIHGKQEIDGGTCGLLIVWMTVPSMLTRTRHTTEEGYLIKPEGVAIEGQPVWVPASSLSAGLVETYEAAVAAAAAELAAARAASAGRRRGSRRGRSCWLRWRDRHPDACGDRPRRRRRTR